MSSLLLPKSERKDGAPASVAALAPPIEIEPIIVMLSGAPAFRREVEAPCVPSGQAKHKVPRLRVANAPADGRANTARDASLGMTICSVRK